MIERLSRPLLIALLLLALPVPSPAPLIYTPGEGWTYEPVGGEGKWRQTRAKDQVEVAQAAFDKQAYGLALKAARRVVKVWPLSDYAPQAQYLLGRAYEAKGRDEKAFREYQRLIDRYPKLTTYQDIIVRQDKIADKFLAGKRFKIWGVFPFFRSMEKTAEMYAKIVKNGPYSDLAPQAQLKIGTAREKQKNFPLAVRAYELAADRYNDRPAVAAEALFRAGSAYYKQSKKADYDQNTAAQAIATFTDFITLFPNESRVPEAQKLISALRAEQARGAFATAQFYEKRNKWQGALVYYNEVILRDPTSPYASTARERIESLKPRVTAK